MSLVAFALRRSGWFALLLLAPIARANTYMVDVAGTGQFTDIQPAIVASQPGDVLLVAAGTYGGFTLDKGLTVIGYGVVRVSGSVHVVNIAAGERAALVRMRPNDVSVSGCFGTVLLEELTALHALVVSQSNDVRAARVAVDASVGPNSHSGADGAALDNARLELVDSTVLADWGFDAGSPGYPNVGGTGGTGIVAGPSVRLHSVLSQVGGNYGGNGNAYPLMGGDGGNGLRLSTPCEVFLAGPGAHVSGGQPGIATYFVYDCQYDGRGGCAIAGAGIVQHSGTLILGGFTDQSIHCGLGLPPPGYYEPSFCGPTELPAVPVDPSLKLTGLVTAGGTVTLTVNGEPGAIAVIRIGRNPIVVQTAGVDIEQLTGANRMVTLGPIPASGSIARNVVVPASWLPGNMMFCQADVTGTGGLKRTNSVPLIDR